MHYNFGIICQDKVSVFTIDEHFMVKVTFDIEFFWWYCDRSVVSIVDEVLVMYWKFQSFNDTGTAGADLVIQPWSYGYFNINDTGASIAAG